jgi:hypothetical protein
LAPPAHACAYSTQPAAPAAWLNSAAGTVEERICSLRDARRQGTLQAALEANPALKLGLGDIDSGGLAALLCIQAETAQQAQQVQQAQSQQVQAQ